MNLKSLELWQHRIADRKTSGLNVTNWCKKNNLTKHDYYYWLKRIETHTQNINTSIPVFAEVKSTYITQCKNVNSDIQITRHDINLTVSDSNTVKLAAEFISRLQRLC